MVSGIGFQMMALLPGALGLLKELTNTDIIYVQIPGETEVEFTESMQYMIFSPRRAASPTVIKLQSVSTGEILTAERETEPVYYQTDLIKGTLLYQVPIKQPGFYRIIENQDAAPQTFFLVPNISRHNTMVILLFYGTLAGVIITIIFFFYRRSQLEDKALAQQKAAKWDKWSEMRKADSESFPPT